MWFAERDGHAAVCVLQLTRKVGTIEIRAEFGAIGSFRNDEHNIKVGLNYRFGWGQTVGGY